MDSTGVAGSKLTEALRKYAAAGFSGLLRVNGTPGGTVYFVDGQVCACETAGAPGLEVVLLRSGRIAEPDWNAAYVAAALAGSPLTAQLVESGLLGAGEAEALLRTALADAVFAVVSGRVDGWAEGPAGECQLPLDPPARCHWLLGEAERRAQVLAAFPGPALSAQDRVAASAAPPAGRALLPGEGEVLLLADGRRTPRDLAFARGRGLFETMLQLARMRAAGVVVVSEPDAEPASRGRAAARAPEAVAARTGTGLPHRKGRPGAPRAGEASLRGLAANIRLLRPRAGGNPTPDGGR